MSRENYPKYYLYGELEFPYAERVYFDHLGDEFKTNTIQNKLLDIGYMLFHNYDVRAMIHHTYGDGHISVTENNVRYTLCLLLGELLHVDPIILMLKYKKLPTDEIIDIFFSNLMRYYHLEPNGKHYIKSPKNMTEQEVKMLNPWKEVVEKYVGSEFLFSDNHNLVCECDRDIIEEYNKNTDEKYKYHLNVPAYPWYGNPLKANVIVLTLNPGYVKRESVIARVIQDVHERYTEGYTEHLRRMLLFDCAFFLPDKLGKEGMTYRDLANLHQSWYWEDRLTKAFVSEETGLTFEDVNSNFAVIQYIGYSSEKYAPLKKGRVLPSQYYTKQLIEYITNNTNTIFIVTRNVKMWKQFLGIIWDDNRFIISKDYLGQHFTKDILGKEAFDKVIKAFKD